MKDKIEAIRRGDRVALARAITQVESKKEGDREQAFRLIKALLPYTGQSYRIGITGSPGVGKSTFINTFGKYLIGRGHKVAVLAIDPLSPQSGGSIMGDKSRMNELALDSRAFIRPSTSGWIGGGVSHCTREIVLLCEAAGFDRILVETIGAGQSEVAVRDVVDFFLLLLLPGAGDEWQGIKRGIMEMADGLVVTKADSHNKERASIARSQLVQALHVFRRPSSGYSVQVILTSALEKTGLEEVGQMLESYRDYTKSTGYFTHLRKRQRITWFRDALKQQIHNKIVSLVLSEQDISSEEQRICNHGNLPVEEAKKLVDHIIDRLKK